MFYIEFKSNIPGKIGKPIDFKYNKVISSDYYEFFLLIQILWDNQLPIYKYNY